MTDPVETALRAMRAKHLKMRGKFIADLDKATGYTGSGEAIADEVLAYLEDEFRRKFTKLERGLYS